MEAPAGSGASGVMGCGETRAGVAGREGAVLEGPGGAWEHRQGQGLLRREAVFLRSRWEGQTQTSVTGTCVPSGNV